MVSYQLTERKLVAYVWFFGGLLFLFGGDFWVKCLL